MRTVPLVLTGYGNVGRAFVRLLRDKRAALAGRYGLDFDLSAVLRRGGGWAGEGCDDLEALAEDPRAPLESHRGWVKGLNLAEALSRRGPGVLVECTPSNWKTGEPQLAFMHLALERGWHIAAASKGALVVDYENLAAKARSGGLSLMFSGATASALPTLDVATISLAGSQIQRIEGILTGTTNHILGRLEAGLTFEAALAEAQAQGIAETDPSMDIDGWDTACKLLLISNAAVGTTLAIGQIRVEGIRCVTAHDLRIARIEGKVIKLLGRLVLDGGRTTAEVKPMAIDPSHPLFAVSGMNKGIAFLSDTMGTIVVTGGKSDPRGTAASVLKDVINIFR